MPRTLYYGLRVVLFLASTLLLLASHSLTLLVVSYLVTMSIIVLICLLLNSLQHMIYRLRVSDYSLLAYASIQYVLVGLYLFLHGVPLV